MSNVNAHRPGYKHTPLGWIPEEWEVRFMRDIADIFVGRDLKEDCFAEKKNESHVFPVYSNTVDNRGLYGYYNFEEYSGQSLTIVGRGVGIGTAFSRNHSYGAIGRLLVLFPKNGVSAEYLTNYINSKVNFFIESSGIPQLTGEQVARYKIALPPIEQQHKISLMISIFDEAISITQKLVSKLRQRNKGLNQQLLLGKRRLSGFKDKWSRLHIADIANEVSSKNKQDNQLTVLSCTKHAGLVDSLKYFGRKVYSEDTSNYKIVLKNHFAYATNHIEEGSIGYQDKYDEALISPMYTVFRTSKEVHNEFLYFLLKSHEYIHEYRKRMEGSIDRRGGLRWEGFSRIPILLPSYEEQQRIANALSEALNEVYYWEKKLTVIQQQKKALLQKLLTGEIRVKVN